MKRDLVKPLGSKKKDFFWGGSQWTPLNALNKWQIIVQDIEVEVFKQYKIIMEQAVKNRMGSATWGDFFGVVLLVLHGYVNQFFLDLINLIPFFLLNSIPMLKKCWLNIIVAVPPCWLFLNYVGYARVCCSHPYNVRPPSYKLLYKSQ